MRRRSGVDGCVHLPAIPAYPDTEAHFASRNAWQPLALQRFGRRMNEGEGCHDDAAGKRREGRRPADHLCRHGGVHYSETCTAKALRHEQTWQAEFNQAVPQSFVEATAGLGVMTQRVDRHTLGQQATQRVREKNLFLAERELHQTLATFGSRGRSRPRSAMMFFWMLFEPPPIISPTSYR
jgi:hypothetical protein